MAHAARVARAIRRGYGSFGDTPPGVRAVVEPGPAVSRAARLLDLLQALRRRRRPVSAATLSAELGVSLRTVYRDIATLTAGGAAISGEAGVGYVMRPGLFLPPLMFESDELDALILGLRLVARRGDPDLARAAGDTLAKIAAVLPPEREDAFELSGLIAAPAAPDALAAVGPIRRALRAEEKLKLRYRDKAGVASERIVWPVALGFFDGFEMLAAWCEMRQDFRHFRLDRIDAAEPCGSRTPRRRRLLLAEWRAAEGLRETAAGI